MIAESPLSKLRMVHVRPGSTGNKDRQDTSAEY